VKKTVFGLLIGIGGFLSSVAFAQQGGIRGTVMDQDFEVPLPGVKVLVSETGQETETGDAGSYVFEAVEPGAYTLLFSKSGYTRATKPGVVVSPGQLAEVDTELAGEYEEMDELVVRDIQLGGASEIGLLNLRMESSALMDSVGADLMSQAGASDAAQALQLVPGTTVQDGKYAVVRGLPDRYVSAQMNGVRLPTADVDKRAVQLDQFPSAMIESIQVSKTFTPDQQGDASGGAVNVVLKGIPDGRVFKGGLGFEVNTQVLDAGDRFLTYKNGGVDYWGYDDGARDQQTPNTSWKGAVGVSRDDAPLSYKWGVTAGDNVEFDSGLKVGALGSFFYKRDASYYENGVEDSYWVDNPGEAMSPQYTQGTPQQNEFYTKLFDTTKGVEEVQWGGLAAVGVEMAGQALSLLYSTTHAAEDEAVLQENTRGKHYYFPGHDPYADQADQTQANGYGDAIDASPYIRNETLEYTERDTETLQLRGEHVLPLPDWGFGSVFRLLDPKVDWTVAESSSALNSPDKRQFGTKWIPGYIEPGINFPPFIVLPPTTNAPTHYQKKEAANINLGNLQRIWKNVEETSEQYFINGRLPFEQWSGDEGFLKLGLFNDHVERNYRQESFSNSGSGESGKNYAGDWQDLWSAQFPSETHPILASNIDVDYEGIQDIAAWYYMIDMPLASFLKIIGGARFESTDISIVNDPEPDVKWYPNGVETTLNPGDADVDFSQRDVLPSIGIECIPMDKITIRASYSETVARQTFKELTPIQQQEYLGADIFIGNPELQMSALKNYDLRFDFTPYPGGLLSASWFHKDVDRPIEYRQELFSSFIGTTAINYPDGKMDGFEVELRQSLGQFWDAMEGIQIGGNFTLIDSEVSLPQSERDELSAPNIQAPRNSRAMLNAPEYLYNLNATWSLKRFGSEFGLFYSVKGDTLVSGAGTANGNFVPDIYEAERGSLNFTFSQKLGEHLKLTFKAKNLTDAEVKQVYRSEYIGSDVTRSSYRKGIDYAVELSGTW